MLILKLVVKHCCHPNHHSLFPKTIWNVPSPKAQIKFTVKRPALIPGVVMVSGGETANTALVRNGPRHRGVPRDGPGACAMLLGRRGPRGSVTALKGRPFVTEAP